jgi:integrase
VNRLSAVHDADGAGLGRQQIERVHIVQLAIRDVDEARDIAAQVEQGGHLHRRFGRAEMRPGKHRQAPAIEVLQALPRFANNPYVIVGNMNGKHLVNLQKPWRTIRSIAKLDDVRIHDLRHTFASVAVASGGSLPVIGKQLGHSQPITTQRYAHLADDPVRKLTQTTGEALALAMKQKPKQA